MMTSSVQAGSDTLTSTQTSEPLGGRYRLEELIGTGGTGAVWRARDLTLGVDVAVKVLRRHLDRRTVEERFRNEAQLLARLDHPNLVEIRDLGISASGEPFLVMEMLVGTDLWGLLQKGPLTPVAACTLTLPVLEGLRAAHRQGVIHRDVKPENIFLSTSYGRTCPKVLDFGAALIHDLDPDLRITRTGTIVGSPYYMAPEQARAVREVDARVDIWGICATLYECVSGRLPFQQDDLGAQLNAIACEEPDSLGLDGEAGQRLEAVIMKGLRKDREARWQSIDDLGRELARWLLSEGVEVDISNQSIRSVWLSPVSNPLATTLRSPVKSLRLQARSEQRRAGAHVTGAISGVRKRLTVLSVAAGCAIGLSLAAAAPPDPSRDPTVATSSAPAAGSSERHGPGPRWEAPRHSAQLESSSRSGAPRVDLVDEAMAPPPSPDEMTPGAPASNSPTPATPHPKAGADVPPPSAPAGGPDDDSAPEQRTDNDSPATAKTDTRTKREIDPIWGF